MRSEAMSTGLRRSLRQAADERGQALVEFALIAPLLLLLVLGVVEFGRAWHSYQVVTDAAREGARVAVVGNRDPAIQEEVLATVRDALGRAGLDPDRADIQLSGIPGSVGDPAQVAISYAYRLTWLRPLMGWTLEDASISLKTAFVMRNE